MLPTGDKEDSIHHNMEILTIEDEVEVVVKVEEELVFMVMVEVKTCYREIWSIIDKIELGYQ